MVYTIDVMKADANVAEPVNGGGSGSGIFAMFRFLFGVGQKERK
ncbi:hypothetical protein [Methanospirillum sp.]|nr:hypothetical protein [Methanospirillum sp.]